MATRAYGASDDMIELEGGEGEVMADKRPPHWTDVHCQRDADGNPTLLARAVQVLSDNGFDCEDGEREGGEPGPCLACRCEAALKDLWEQLTAPRVNPLAAMRTCEYCGMKTRITTAGCDHCNFEDK